MNKRVLNLAYVLVEVIHHVSTPASRSGNMQHEALQPVPYLPDPTTAQGRCQRISLKSPRHRRPSTLREPTSGGPNPARTITFRRSKSRRTPAPAVTKSFSTRGFRCAVTAPESAVSPSPTKALRQCLTAGASYFFAGSQNCGGTKPPSSFSAVDHVTSLPSNLTRF